MNNYTAILYYDVELYFISALCPRLSLHQGCERFTAFVFLLFSHPILDTDLLILNLFDCKQIPVSNFSKWNIHTWSESRFPNVLIRSGMHTVMAMTFFPCYMSSFMGTLQNIYYWDNRSNSYNPPRISLPLPGPLSTLSKVPIYTYIYTPLYIQMVITIEEFIYICYTVNFIERVFIYIKLQL